MADPTSPSTRPPDHPAVPRAATIGGAGVWIALVLTLVIVGGYAWLGITERELSQPERDEVPASVRASPGGYRSFHFWHSGYHGGK